MTTRKRITGNLMRGSLIAGATIALVFIAVVNGDKAIAYESYHDPNTEDAGYCASCHPGFVGRGDLHDLHVGSADFTQECDLCHTGSGRDNPLTLWSVNDNLGCAGCHGRDYGETTNGSYRGLPTQGKPKASGWGLRLQHENKNVTECINCHGTSTIHGEDVDPPYYARADVDITDACNSDGTEDGTPEPNGEDTFGLDNDGDTLIDGVDPDCSVASDTPGESEQITVAINRTTGVLTLSWLTGCVSTDNVIEYGDLNNVGSYTWAGQECNIGTTGTYDWTPPVSPESLFFVIVGRDASAEGSYGKDSAAVERPPDTTSTTCPLGQDLTSTCVP